MIRASVGISIALTAGTALADMRQDVIRENAMRLPDVRPELLADAIDAAFSVETQEVPAELLLALAWYESRFEPDLRLGRVCGALQVVPEDVGERDKRDACRRWGQDTRQGFEAGAREIRTWLGHSHGSLRIALRARACGWIGLTQSCGKDWWIRLVRRRAHQLQQRRRDVDPS